MHREILQITEKPQKTNAMEFSAEIPEHGALHIEVLLRDLPATSSVSKIEVHRERRVQRRGCDVNGEGNG